MNQVNLTIDGQDIEVKHGTTILEAAKSADIYIPTLCYHPDLPPAKSAEAAEGVHQGTFKIENALPHEPAKGCGLCVVEIEGEDELAGSCAREVRDGMVVITDSERVKDKRQENLVPILRRHRHACLTCAQQEGCSRSQCSANVPENERCCTRFGHCELQNVANYVGISPETPKWNPTDLPVFKEDPLFERDYNLCIGCTRCVRACRDLRGVEAIGFVHDKEGRVQVGTLGPTLEESACKFCTACVEVCPTGALMDKAVQPGKKEGDIVPCKEACPAHIDVPRYLRLIARGDQKEADAVIREKVPFPGILGRVCVRPCEEVCRRAEVNEPIAICALKRYVADSAENRWEKQAEKISPTGKKVAVVGAGPSGLTAAFYLRKQGHGVTVFEARVEPGGMMRYAIPAYRLPRNVLDQEIKDILDLGIGFRPNQVFGTDVTIAQLKNDGFEAVFLGVGAPLSRTLSIEGSDLPDVLWGVDFLIQIAEEKEVPLKDRVIVVGGGNVAVDVALSAMRSGAKTVTMVCLEKHEEMPAHDWEIKGLTAEGVHIKPSWGPHRVLTEKGRVTGLETARCTSVFDDKGNFAPIFDGKRHTFDGDQVIMAIGQASDLSFLKEEDGISIKDGLIVVNGETMETGLRGVYAGGDVVTASGAIIHAIASGRKAASAIDKALGGTGKIEDVLFERKTSEPNLGRDEGFAFWPREEVPELPIEKRHQGFHEVSLGYDDEQAQKEARRCLQCDLRIDMGCNPAPPEKIQAFNGENVSQLPDTEGVYRLYDKERRVISIKGTPRLRDALLLDLAENTNAAWFDSEEDQMYSRRESELIQQHLQEHGEMPGGGDSDLDDLF